MARRAEPSRTRTSKPQCGSPTLTVICWEMKEACLPQCFWQFVASLWANVNKQHMRKFLNCNPQPLFTTRLRLGNELESVATPVLSGCLRISKSKWSKGSTKRQWVGKQPCSEWLIFVSTPFGPIGPLGHFERCWKLRCTCGSGQQLEEESVSQVLQVPLPTLLHLNCQHLHDLNSPLLATDYQG